ncbi:hypothetical protein [Azomonas macrocytogenes]|uniref:Uncharacterized protein n=1 Tax=Azomonas macrocytogenes TaxID=69962 RepID=A0A839T8B6_AZOMA|nr:hypothetical protein [Azomonas macrocytogenes]MBB3105110.1 hypothetical protein [Azomonas macrocytogenes]
MQFGHDLQLIIPGIALLFLSACANIEAHITEYVGAPHISPTSPASVEVLRSEPTRPHDRLGEVVLDASTEPSPPVNEIEQKLREEAAKIGGEAVVVVYDQIQPVAAYVSGPLWDRDIQTIQGRKLKGIVIRYKN